VRLPVGTARLGEQPGVADSAVTGGFVAHHDRELQGGQPGQPAEHNVGVRAAAVLAWQDDRGGAGAPQHEVHFPWTVDHYHRQQDRTAQGSRHLDDRTRIEPGNCTATTSPG